MATQTTPTTIDDIFKVTPVGSINTAAGNAFYGINHRQQAAAIPVNKDMHGLTFFVRPQLNLTEYNMRTERQLIPLLTEEPASIQRIIRNYLDPRLGYLSPNLTSPFVDNTNPFIPIMSNFLLSCTGWPDPVIESFTSKPGAYKEVWGYVDGVVDKYSTFSLTCSFRNMAGNPILKILYYWQIYMANVHEGVMSPYPDFIINNTIDYNTRIYRLILDKNKRFVSHIACTGVATPESVPLGTMFNFEHEEPLNQANKEISVQFKCYGYCYDDDIIIYEFNKAVEIFNPGMKDANINNLMVKIPYEALSAFNNKGYPRINPRTYELEWYVSTADYKAVMVKYENTLNYIGLTVGMGPEDTKTRKEFYDPTNDPFLKRDGSIKGVGAKAGIPALGNNLTNSLSGLSSGNFSTGNIISSIADEVASWF